MNSLTIMLATLLNTSTAMLPTAIEYNGKPTPAQYIEIYAHRGGRGLLPESTLPAYRAAVNHGNITYVDMDINMTRDGVLVVNHDFSLNRNITRDRHGQWIKQATPIYQLTYQQLQLYNVGAIKPGSHYASYFPQQQSLAEAHIPTLKQVVEEVKALAGNRVGFQIEIKSDPTRPQLSASPQAYAKALNQLLLEERIVDRTEVQSFDFRCLLALKTLNPAIKTAFLTLQPESQDSRWTAGYRLSDYDNSFPTMVRALGGDCWEPFEMDLTQAKLDQAHTLGLKVAVWGMPEREAGSDFNQKQIKKLIKWGVDGIITDRPDELQSLLVAMEPPPAVEWPENWLDQKAPCLFSYSQG